MSVNSNFKSELKFTGKSTSIEIVSLQGNPYGIMDGHPVGVSDTVLTPHARLVISAYVLRNFHDTILYGLYGIATNSDSTVLA